MLTSGDVVQLDLGMPAGRQVGSRHPAVVVTAREILGQSTNAIQLVPLTSTVREYGSEVGVMAEAGTGLNADYSAPCQHIRSVFIDRVESVRGNVGPVALSEIARSSA